MIGVLVQLAISWIIIWLVERKNLSVLGFMPTKKRIVGLLFFFIITALCCTSGFLLKMYFANQSWKVNPALSTSLILDGISWNIASVLFEELIFRGVLLYILVTRLGPLKAIIISAVAFGIYHWFSYGIFGQVVPMIIFFFITGTMGLLLAFGYTRTFSLYIPIGIHLGWNLTQNFIFSSGPIGNGILVQVTGSRLWTNSMLIFIGVTFLPMMATFLVNYLLIKKQKQENVFSKSFAVEAV